MVSYCLTVLLSAIGMEAEDFTAILDELSILLVGLPDTIATSDEVMSKGVLSL